MKSPYEVIQDLLECFPKKCKENSNNDWIWYWAGLVDKEQDEIKEIIIENFKCFEGRFRGCEINCVNGHTIMRTSFSSPNTARFYCSALVR